MAEIIPLTCGPQNHFFGFFGRSPWSVDGSKVLTLETSLYDKAPKPDDQASVGYVRDDGSKEFVAVSSTTAWNWQQGSILYWMGGFGSEAVLHNARMGDKFVAIVVDIVFGEQVILPKPIYCIDSSCKWGLSVNFARLHRLRPGYGYAGPEDGYAREAAPSRDGIFLVDLLERKTELVLSLQDIAGFSPCAEVRKASAHCASHALFSPSGRKFCFLHSAFQEDGIAFIRLLISDRDGSNLRSVFEGMVSHFDWKNEDEILAWAGHRRLLSRARGKGNIVKKLLNLAKPIYYRLGQPRWVKHSILKDAYHIIHDGERPSRIVSLDGLCVDGHCSYSANKEWFVTDTYPDKHGTIQMMVCNEMEEAVNLLAEMGSDLELQKDCRSDLHPRWHHSRSRICIDSSHEGGRQMYAVDVSHVVGQ